MVSHRKMRIILGVIVNHFANQFFWSLSLISSFLDSFYVYGMQLRITLCVAKCDLLFVF